MCKNLAVSDRSTGVGWRLLTVPPLVVLCGLPPFTVTWDEVRVILVVDDVELVLVREERSDG